MGDPYETERIRDAERRSAQRERSNDELKAKVREIREIMGRFGIKERSQGEYIMDFQALIAGLGSDQARELATALNEAGHEVFVPAAGKKRGRPRKVTTEGERQ